MEECIVVSIYWWECESEDDYKSTLPFSSSLILLTSFYCKVLDLFNLHLKDKPSHLAYFCEMNFLFYLLPIPYSVFIFSNTLLG